jgi:hypothetical protein
MPADAEVSRPRLLDADYSFLSLRQTRIDGSPAAPGCPQIPSFSFSARTVAPQGLHFFAREDDSAHNHGIDI